MKKTLGLFLLALSILTLSCGDDDEKTLKPSITSSVPYQYEEGVKSGASKIEINFYDKIEIDDLSAFVLVNQTKETEQSVTAVMKAGDKGFSINVTLEASTDYLFIIPDKNIKTYGSNLYMSPYNLAFSTAK